MISTEEAVVEVPQSTVVFLEPMDETFWEQLRGGVDYGCNFTGGNSQTQSTFNGNVEYPTTRYRVSVSASSVFSGQADGLSKHYPRGPRSWMLP